MRSTLMVIISALFTSFYGYCQEIKLPHEAKIKVGDNPEWAKLSFDDSGWHTQRLGNGWKIKDLSPQTEKDVYAWARIKVFIPSSFKNAATKENGLKLYIGKIDDADQTYFNEELIGHTGGFPPVYETRCDVERIYIIPVNSIHWDAENIIAVRVFSPDIWGMGTMGGTYKIAPNQWFDSISVASQIKETNPNEMSTEIRFLNNGQKSFDGIIKYAVKSQSGQLLFSQEKTVHVESGPGSNSLVSFSFSNDQQVKVVITSYEITDKDRPASLSKEQYFLTNSNIINEIKPVVQNKIPDNFHSIPFQNQRYSGYLNTRLMQNMEQRLLKVDEEGISSCYLNRPGNQPWQGEHIGKYLEAATNVWKLTHNPELKKQMDRMMFVLINSQLNDGYLGTYTPDEYWKGWDVWSHKYNLHGLLAYYSATGYQPALDACKKIGNLLCKTFGKETGQKDIITAGEHKGMAATSVLDAMVELYKFTGEKRYLDFCYYILNAWDQDNGPKIISSILKTGKVTDVGNGKAYEMLSNYVGLMKLYQVTGEENFLKATTAAWQDIVDNHLYITGTTSSDEYFHENGYLPAAEKDHVGEGCVTTTWIQLNQNLFSTTGDIKYLDQLEKTVYNHLLGAENPQTGCVGYFTPLMDKKTFTCNITCCTSSVPRGIALIPAFTFGNIKSIPTFLFYEPAVYKEKITTPREEILDVVFSLSGNFPESGELSITVETSKPAEFPLALRVPLWCTNFVAKAGDKEYKGLPDEFVTINKTWKPGEKISIRFDMPMLTFQGGKSYPNLIAFQRGPQVLAMDNTLNVSEVNDLIFNSKENKKALNPKPASGSKILPGNWIGTQVFVAAVMNNNKPISMHLVPFADASQTGGDIRVWLPLNISK